MKSILNLLFIGIAVSLLSCDKNKEKPETQSTFGTIISTVFTRSIDVYSQEVGGHAVLEEVGFCWSTEPLPELSDSKIISSYNIDGFSSHIEGFLAGTTYFIRSYAKTSKGLVYGDERSFTTYNMPSNSPIVFNPAITYGSVLDNEGTSYKTVVIGNQTWMAENLKTKHFNNGDLIPTTSFTTILDDENTVPAFGRLYKYYAPEDPRGICPIGYHIPTLAEWDSLFAYIGFDYNKIKESGSEHWVNGGEGNNSTGFSLIPSGYYLNYDIGVENDYLFGIGSCLWTSYEYNSDAMYAKYFGFSSNGLFSKSSSLSIRCIKD